MLIIICSEFKAANLRWGHVKIFFPYVMFIQHLLNWLKHSFTALSHVMQYASFPNNSYWVAVINASFHLKKNTANSTTNVLALSFSNWYAFFKMCATAT